MWCVAAARLAFGIRKLHKTNALIGKTFSFIETTLARKSLVTWHLSIYSWRALRLAVGICLLLISCAACRFAPCVFLFGILLI